MLLWIILRKYKNKGVNDMDKLTGVKTETFDLGFRLDIVTTSECYEGYIYHKNNGIRSLMFGLPKKQQSYKDALAIFERNIPDYIGDYINEFMSA